MGRRKGCRLIRLAGCRKWRSPWQKQSASRLRPHSQSGVQSTCRIEVRPVPIIVIARVLGTSSLFDVYTHVHAGPLLASSEFCYVMHWCTWLRAWNVLALALTTCLFILYKAAARSTRHALEHFALRCRRCGGHIH